MNANVELSEQIVIRITPEMLRQLQSVSAADERTVAQTVRFAIRAFLAETTATRLTGCNGDWARQPNSDRPVTA